MCFFLCSTTSNISRVQVLAASKPQDGGKFNFFVNWTFSFEIDQLMLNMPKFSKTCHNPLHDDWNKKSIDSRIINLRAHRLPDVLNAYKSLESRISVLFALKCCKINVLQQFCPWEQHRTYYFNGFL